MSWLRVETVGSSAPRARLADFVHRAPGPDRAIWRTDGGELVAVQSQVKDVGGVAVRTRVRLVRREGRWHTVDRIRFELHEDRFVEHAPQGELVLPAELELGVPHRPHPRDPRTVTLRWCGPAVLTLDGAAATRDAIQLVLAGPHADPWEQWLVRDVGEVRLGRLGARPTRWLVGWQTEGEALFAAQAGQAAR